MSNLDLTLSFIPGHLQEEYLEMKRQYCFSAYSRFSMALEALETNIKMLRNASSDIEQLYNFLLNSDELIGVFMQYVGEDVSKVILYNFLNSTD